MVKNQKNDNSQKVENQGNKGYHERANRIVASTGYEYCDEHLSYFGGLLGLVKFLDLVKFEDIFEGKISDEAK